MTLTSFVPTSFNTIINGVPTGAPTPDVTWKNWLVDTSGSLVTNVADNNTGTRIKQPLNSSSTRTHTVGGWAFNNLVVPASTYIKQLRWRFNYDVNYITAGRGCVINAHITKNDYGGQFGGLSTQSFVVSSANQGTTTAISTRSGAWLPLNPNTNLPWDVTDLINNYSVYVTVAPFGDVGDIQVRIYEVSLQLEFNTIPTVGITPTGTVTNTTSPPLVVSYLDVDGDAPDREDIRLFTQAQYTAPGFDPATSANIFSKIDAITFATSTFSYSVTIPQLQNNSSYQAFARLRQQQDSVWSNWASSIFTISLDTPQAPTLNVTLDNNNAAVILDVVGNDNLLNAGQSSFETGTTTGWSAGTGTTIANSTQAIDGTHSMSVTRSSSTGTADAFIAANARRTVSVGRQYTGLASFKASSTGRSCNVALIFYDAGGTAIGAPAIGSNITDTTGGWTQATVAATAPVGASTVELDVNVLACPSGELHFVDKTGIMPDNNTTWSFGGFSTPSSIQVEASVNNRSWTTIRNGQLLAWPDVTNRSGELVWYEAIPGVPTSYRACVIGLVNGVSVQGPYSTIVTVTSLPNSDPPWWLIDPLNPENNMQVDMSGSEWDYSYTEEQAVFHVLGKKFPVVISDVAQAKTGTLPVYFTDRDSFNQFLALRDTQHTLLVKRVYQAAYDQFYVRFGANLSVKELNTTPISIEASIDFTEVDVP